MDQNLIQLYQRWAAAAIRLYAEEPFAAPSSRSRRLRVAARAAAVPLPPPAQGRTSTAFTFTDSILQPRASKNYEPMGLVFGSALSGL